MKSNQFGRSMIEMLGVLAIIGVLSVGGIAGYSKAMAKYRTNKIIDQVSMLIANIRTLYAQQLTYVNLDNELAIDMGAVPEELIVYDANGNVDSEHKLKNIFGGRVVIGSSAFEENGDDAESFVVLISGISREACIQVATSDWGSGTTSGLLGMHVFTLDDDPTDISDDEKIVALTKTTPGDEDEGLAVPSDANIKIPMRVDQARKSCACMSKSNCAVSWKYY